MASFTLSIVIPTHNGLAHLRRCLPSVKRHAPPGTQIVVVDDASSDGTGAWMRKVHPDIELISLATNHGFCRAVNAGLARVSGDIVELLNNDTEVFPNWADACLKHFGDPEVGSVAPLVTQLERENIIDSCGQVYHICGWAYNRGYGRPPSARPRSTWAARDAGRR